MLASGIKYVKLSLFATVTADPAVECNNSALTTTVPDCKNSLSDNTASELYAEEFMISEIYDESTVLLSLAPTVLLKVLHKT